MHKKQSIMYCFDEPQNVQKGVFCVSLLCSPYIYKLKRRYFTNSINYIIRKKLYRNPPKPNFLSNPTRIDLYETTVFLCVIEYYECESPNFHL